MERFEVLWLDEKGKILAGEIVLRDTLREACVFAGLRFRQSSHKIPETCAGFLCRPDTLTLQEKIDGASPVEV